MKFECKCNGYILTVESIEEEKDCYKTSCLDILSFCEDCWKVDFNTLIGSFISTASELEKREEMTIRIVTRD